MHLPHSKKKIGEAPFGNILVLYGHCPNSFRPPPPLSKRQMWNKSAPKHPDKPLHPSHPLKGNAHKETTHFKMWLPLLSLCLIFHTLVCKCWQSLTLAISSHLLPRWYEKRHCPERDISWCRDTIVLLMEGYKDTNHPSQSDPSLLPPSPLCAV